MAPTTSTLDRVQNDGSLCGNEIAQKGQNDGYTLTSVTSAVSRPLFSNPFSHMWGLKGRTKIVRGPRCLLNWNPNLSPSTASNAAICNSINSPKEPRNSSSNSSSCVLVLFSSSPSLPSTSLGRFSTRDSSPIRCCQGLQVVQDFASLLRMFWMFRALEGLRGWARHSNHLDISGPFGKEHSDKMVTQILLSCCRLGHNHLRN